MKSVSMTTASYTAEYVSPKHPDKMCDRISDAILEKFIRQDPHSRVAVEALGGHGRVFIMGEVTSAGNLSQQDYENIVADITGFTHYKVEVFISQQSAEIAAGVDAGGAGDQGIVIGYACNHNERMLPHEHYLAQSLCDYLFAKYPVDGKTQITINDKHEITHLVASFQNTKTVELHDAINHWLNENRFPTSNIKYFVNPAGEWTVGGFEADTGLTGRKIVIDQYGPRVSVGGGAFSGKDWTKIDRSAAYYAKHIAQELLKEHHASEVRVMLAYAIGEKNPLQAIASIDSVPYDITDYNVSMQGIKNFIHQQVSH